MRGAWLLMAVCLASACADRRQAVSPTGEEASLVASDTAFMLIADSIVPEAIAIHRGTLLVGSIAQQRVFRVAPSSGRVGKLLAWSPPLGGAVLGLEVDTTRGVLWAAVEPPAGRGSGALVALRLDDGTVAHSSPLPVAGSHLPNDLEVAPDGTIYLTDTEGGVVWSRARGSSELTVAFGRAEGLSHPNGVALSPDGGTIYIAYDEGIAVGRTNEGRLWMLPAPPGVALGGIDGLYLVGDALVGIQNAMAVPQLVRLSLSPDGKTVERATTLERGHPAHEVPTTGALLDGDLLYLANSQLDRWQAGRAIGDTVLVLRLPSETLARERSARRIVVAEDLTDPFDRPEPLPHANPLPLRPRVQGAGIMSAHDDDGGAELEVPEWVARADGKRGIIGSTLYHAPSGIRMQVIEGDTSHADHHRTDQHDGDRATGGWRDSDHDPLVHGEETFDVPHGVHVHRPKLSRDVGGFRDGAVDRNVDAVIVAGGEVDRDEGASGHAVGEAGVTEQRRERVVTALRLDHHVVGHDSVRAYRPIDGRDEGALRDRS